MNKAPAFTSKEDENIFKMPMVPRKSSPKSRLSPKTVPTFDNATTSSASNATSTPIFGSNKLAQLKVPTAQATARNNDIFGNFNQSTPKADLFGNNSGSNSLESKTAQQSKSTLLDLPDGRSSTFSGTKTAFGKMAESSATAAADNLFSGFSQKSDSGSSPFVQVTPSSQPKPNLFGNATANAPSVFGSFVSAETNQQTTVGSTTQTGLFGGFKGTANAMAGIKPLVGAGTELMDKREREQEAMKLEAAARKKALEKEMERRRKEELEREREKAEEEKQMQLERKKLEIEKASKELSAEIIDEFVSSNLNDIATSQIQWYREIEEAVNKIYVELVHDVIDTELKTIAIDVKNAWDKNILEKYFALWRVMARKRIEQRKKIANTPLWMPRKSMKELIPELRHPLQAKTLSLMERYRSGASKLIAPPVPEDSIDLWGTIAPNLIKLLEEMKGKRTQHIYWKCVISIPDAQEDPSCQSISQWLDNIFYRQQSKHPRPHDVFFVEQHDYNHHQLNVCLRKMIGRKMLNESNEKVFTQTDMDGTNAILFVLSAKNLNATRERIRTVLQAMELNDSLALIIYSIDETDLGKVADALNLDEYLDAGKLNDGIFINRNLCRMMKCALKCVAAKSFYNDQLEMQQVVSFLQICLADELWQRIYLSVSRNPTLLEASTRFRFLVDYHNEAIARLISVCKPSCADATLFAFELRQFVPKHQLDIPLGLEYFPENWHKKVDEHQRQLGQFLNSLKIQRDFDLKNVTDVPALETTVLRFVGAHIPPQSEARRTAYKMIQHILAFLNPNELNAIEFKEKLAQYSWLDAFPIFTTDLLSFQYHRFVHEKRLPSYVIYDKDEYQEYIRNAWWLQTNEEMLRDLTTNVLRNIDVTVDEYERNSKRQRLDETIKAAEEKKDLEDILAKGYASLANADKTLDRIKEIHHTCNGISKQLDYGLYRNDVSMRHMKDRLKQVNE